MLGLKAPSIFARILAAKTNGDESINAAAVDILRGMRKAYDQYAGRITFIEFIHMVNAELGVESREAKRIAKTLKIELGKPTNPGRISDKWLEEHT